jgi:hypothetical protein
MLLERIVLISAWVVAILGVIPLTSFEYFIYPAVCIVFVLRFPFRKSIWHKIG